MYIIILEHYICFLFCEVSKVDMQCFDVIVVSS